MSRYIDADKTIEIITKLIYDLVYQLTTPTADVREMMNSAWIPVSKRLPEHCGFFLVTDRIPNASVVRLSYFDDNQQWYGAWNVIAWMPKPEPFIP